MVSSAFPAFFHNKLTLIETFFKFCLVLLRREFLTRTSVFLQNFRDITRNGAKRPLDQLQGADPRVDYWAN